MIYVYIYIYIIWYYTIIKKNEILSFEPRQIKVGDTMLSEITLKLDTEDMCYVLYLI